MGAPRAVALEFPGEPARPSLVRVLPVVWAKKIELHFMCLSDRTRRADSNHIHEGVWMCPQVPKPGWEWPKFGLSARDPLKFFFNNLTKGTQHYATMVSFWCWFRISKWIFLKMDKIVKKGDFMKKIGQKCVFFSVKPIFDQVGGVGWGTNFDRSLAWLVSSFCQKIKCCLARS